MNRLATLTASALALLSTATPAYEESGLSDVEQRCYAKAMVGMDSVINSRLGLPAEHAIALILPNATPATLAVALDRDSTDYLRIIWSAYMWTSSPHSYAIKVLYHCAAQDVPFQATMNQRP